MAHKLNDTGRLFEEMNLNNNGPINMKILILIITVIPMLALVGGCALRGRVMDGDGMVNSYHQISQDDGGIIDWNGETVKEGTDMGDDFNMDPIAYPVVYINGVYFSVEYEDNSSAEAFLEKIKEKPLTIEMHDYANFEKVGDLPWELPTNDEKITTEPGDIILYRGDQITVYYDENTYAFTKLGHLDIDDVDAFRELLGTGDVTVEFSVEWTE